MTLNFPCSHGLYATRGRSSRHPYVKIYIHTVFDDCKGYIHLY
ncbi:hypothetical protein OHB41_51685 [Streptomyces sp. NBC_01571]|nr:hypothetical protein [Streptomyces sp. NBC_01571]MCX4581422.1 hypothetical protein [Streptomyces sp. NBC_01571]